MRQALLIGGFTANWRREPEARRALGLDQRVIAPFAVLNRSQGEMRIWEEVKQWSTSVSQVQVEELQRVT